MGLSLLSDRLQQWYKDLFLLWTNAGIHTKDVSKNPLDSNDEKERYHVKLNRSSSVNLNNSKTCGIYLIEDLVLQAFVSVEIHLCSIIDF